MMAVLEKLLKIMCISRIMTNDEMREIQAQQDELTRKLNEKISDDLRTGAGRLEYKIR